MKDKRPSQPRLKPEEIPLSIFPTHYNAYSPQFLFYFDTRPAILRTEGEPIYRLKGWLLHSFYLAGISIQIIKRPEQTMHWQSSQLATFITTIFPTAKGLRFWGGKLLNYIEQVFSWYIFYQPQIDERKSRPWRRLNSEPKEVRNINYFVRCANHNGWGGVNWFTSTSKK